jgi:hypothetical protein
MPILALMLFMAAESWAEDPEGVNQRLDYKWHLTAYAGISAQRSLGELVTLQAIFPDNTYIAVGALSRTVYRYKHWFSFELEGQIARHFGERENLWEFVGVFIGRWNHFPWDKHVDMSFAIGNGVSYYTEVSEIELGETPEAQRYLNYLLFEVTAGLPRHPRWDAVFRIHHRSGINGLVGHSGANFPSLGLKYSF